MAKKIVWTIKAKNELIDILEYWIYRNKSNTFSIKLNTLIAQQLGLVAKFPDIGRTTDIPNVSIKVINNYLLYYEVVDEVLYVLSIRHTSRNPKTLRIK